MQSTPPAVVPVKPDLLRQLTTAADAAAGAVAGGAAWIAVAGEEVTGTAPRRPEAPRDVSACAQRPWRIGTDVVEIARVERAIHKWKTSFAQRCFTSAEIAYCEAKHRPAQHYAGRLAAKEAVYKALGHDGSEPFRPRSIETGTGRTGEPIVELKGELARQFQGTSVSLSISHDGEYAVAVAIAQVALHSRYHPESGSAVESSEV